MGGGGALDEDEGAVVHSERLRRRPAGGSGGSGGGFLLDWLALTSAHVIVKWGAQHSSFSASARMASCGARQWRSPKGWRYKAASSWLLHKLRFHADKARRNASYDCHSSIAPMLREIAPCRSACASVCRDRLYGAYA